MSRGAVVAASALIALAIAALIYWWQQGQAPALPPITPAAPAVAQAPPPAVPLAPASSAQAAAPVYPIESPAVAEAPPAQPPMTLDRSDPLAASALSQLFNARTIASMLRTDDFVRRSVATIDGLGRDQAAPRLWPVNPAPERFSTVRDGDKEIIAPANAARYAAFVAFIDSIDLARASALYKSNYPLFQSAYKELGYPSGHFNDRLVQVIDIMLATPELSAPPTLQLTKVKGEIPSTQPWLRYEYADPKLEALPAGQKMLLRMGPDNAQRLKARLRVFRDTITQQPSRAAVAAPTTTKP